jgi:hypothetical protein
VTLIDARRLPEWLKQVSPDQVAKWFGPAPDTSGLVGWDIFDADRECGFDVRMRFGFIFRLATGQRLVSMRLLCLID